jgi:primosomal protein N' (replication factor Y)
MDQGLNLVEVAVLLPIRKTFTYEVPTEIQEGLCIGKRVIVPFGRRLLEGVVLGPARKVPPGKTLLAIRQVLEEPSPIPEKLLTMVRWVSDYYKEPIGEVLKCALPIRKKKIAPQAYRLTQKGIAALEAQTLGVDELKILGMVFEKGGEISATLLRKKSRKDSKIGEWVENGLLEEIISGKHSRQKQKYLIFQNNPIPPAKKLGKKQEEIINFLKEVGEISWDQMKCKFQRSWPFLLQLKNWNLIRIENREAPLAFSGEEPDGWIDGPPFILSDDQLRVLERIQSAISKGKYQAFLLFGVTGSGKTEVYLRAIEEVIKTNRQAILLVPEISLTAQMISYFRSRMQQPLAVLHSGLSRAERYREWQRIQEGRVSLAIGVRSAIFAPFPRLGIIIVDEEHDPSYKQEERIHYNARDLALVRGKLEKAIVILGSATPSLESFFNAQQGKIELLTLPSRIERRAMPEVKIVDMRCQRDPENQPPFLSQELRVALERTTAQGEQAILFLNRRGHSTFSLCRDCGFVYRCPNCSVSLIYHLSERTFRCHYCDYRILAPDRCPQCSSLNLELFGSGTQRIEDEIGKMFPKARVLRMDRDTTKKRQAHQKIYEQVRSGKVNLLVGTQMVTKGYDFPRVTLVGVLAADLSLNIPDFRSGERTFQLLTQVAGRTGRGSQAGSVIIQTYNPNHYSIQFAKNQDFEGFYRREIEFRKEMGYPPLIRLIALRMEGNSQEKIIRFANRLAERARILLHEEKKFQKGVEVLGPSPAPLARLKGKFRFQMLFKGSPWAVLHAFAEEILSFSERNRMPGVKMTIDVDPINML